MRIDDRAYFEARATVERARAETASDPVAGQVHRELAELYSARARADEPVPVAAMT